MKHSYDFGLKGSEPNEPTNVALARDIRQVRSALMCLEGLISVSNAECDLAASFNHPGQMHADFQSAMISITSLFDALKVTTNHLIATIEDRMHPPTTTH